MTTIHIAHSPDSDDAFMFYALAEGKIDTDGIVYIHELADIETLNQRALRGELEVTAASIHAYAYLADRYALLPHGASMGDRYGPRLVATSPMSRADVRGKRIAVPGPLTTAYLTLKLYEPDFVALQTPFDKIEEAVLNADVVVLLVPDDDLALVYWEQVAPYARPGSLLLFTGPVPSEIDELPPAVDVAAVLMTEDGCLASVLNDATTQARARALDYLQWLGAEIPRPVSTQIRVREPNDPFPHPMRRVL